MKWYSTLRVAAVAAALALPALSQRVGPEMPRSEDLQQQNARPQVLMNVGVDQKLGAHLPLDSKFRDETGKEVALSEYFGPGRKPALLALVYYDCPMLCNQVLNGLTGALMALKFDVGKEFDVVAVSFDPRETPEMAAAKKKHYVDRYRRPGTAQGWHFLTGSPESIKAITETTGFRYVWDDKTNQFAHGSAVILITPEGKVAQYYYGIEYSPKDMRLGMIEASKEKIGTVVDQLILFCYHYDPTTGKYGAVAMNFLRLGGILTMLVLGTFMFVSFRRDAKKQAEIYTGQAR